MTARTQPKPSLLSRLKRETSSGTYLPVLDGLRFLAVVSVFYFHVASYMLNKATAAYVQTMPHDVLARTLQNGERGVSLFFLISGFILGLPFATQSLEGGKRVTLRNFYLRRLTRLEPPFILCLLLCFGLAIVRLHKPFGEVAAHFLANLTYTHTFVYRSLSPINPVLWSLEVEAQFYLLMPVFALIYRVRGVVPRRALLVGIVVGVMLIYPFFFSAGNGWGRFTALFSLPCFLLGMLLADVYVTYLKGHPVSSKGWDWVALGCVLAMFGVSESVEADRLLMPWLLCLLMISVLCGEVSKRIASLPILCVIGGMCYSIYLFHYELIVVISAVTFRFAVTERFLPNFLLQSLLMTLVVLGFCTVYFLLVEKPCMARDLPQRLLAKFRKPLAAPAVTETSATR